MNNRPQRRGGAGQTGSTPSAIRRGLAGRCLKRRGSLALEAVVAGAVLSLALASLWPVVRTLELNQRVALQQQLAQQEALNCLERLRLMPAPQLSPERLAQEQLSEAALAQLSGGQLRVQWRPAAEQVAPGVSLRALVVEVAWQPRPQLSQSIRLTRWREAEPGSESRP